MTKQLRVYKGWEGKLHVDHPADFPVVKANIDTLQLSALLDPPHKQFHTEEGLKDYRTAFSTDLWESEYILREPPAEIAKNRLEFILTSGGATNRDKGYKRMYEVLFSEMEKRNVDPGSPRIHYILHHVFQPYENRLPEWEEDTTAENAKWLIEKVQTREARK